MTSNLGAAEMNEMISGAMGFHHKPALIDARIDDKITRTAQEAARRKFSPEFMNRIDKVVVFRMLKPEHLEQILEIELGLVQQRILRATGTSQFVFNCTAKVKKFLTQEGTDAKYGARHLKRTIEKNIVFPLANLVATGQVRFGDFVRIDMNGDNRLVFVKEAEGALVPVLLEEYSQEAGAAAAAARATRGVGRREFSATPLLNQK
jgi:ATP-dependent Clp protease ATP-binding subunit ClpA